MKYYYEVYGLKLESDIKIDTLICKDKLNYNIKIKKTSILESEKCLIKANEWFYRGENLFVFYIKTVGYYKVSENLIECDLKSNYDEKDFEAYLLGTSLGIAMFFNSIVAIHGGIIEVSANKGTIIAGQMGAGKSSLIDYFINNGHKFLADDVARIVESEGKLMLSPAYAQRRLCKDYIENSNYNPNLLELRNEDREKYAINDKENYLNKEIYLDSIVELRIADEIRVEKVIGIEKIKVITNNVYRIEILDKEVLKGAYFKRILEIARKINIFRIYRPKEGMYTRIQRNLILKEIGK
ncbi:MAG: hypothetical protein ACRC41_01635 [Sarcina sp.]